MFLFSGAFFPISNLGRVDGVARPADAAVARRRPDPDAHARRRSTGRWPRVHVVYLVVLAVVGWLAGPCAGSTERLVRLMAMLTTSVGRAAASPVSAGEATGLLLYRNYLAYRAAW